MRHIGIAFAIALLCIASAFAADDPAQRYALSIYSAAANNADALFEPAEPETVAPGGYAIVRDRRQFDLKLGNNTVQVRDVARYLDPAALSAHAVTEVDGTTILSQRFEDEPLSFDALAQRHIGHMVEIVGNAVGNAPSSSISGTLLSNVGGLTVQLADGRVATVTEYARVVFPDLPKGLSATPSLRWEVAAKKAGPQTFELVYPTRGLAWRAEYSGWLSGGTDCKLNLSGWAQIANRSGTDFRAAQIKLIAGEPHRVNSSTAARPMMVKAMSSHAVKADDSGRAGDYHEYTLDAAVDLSNGSMLRAALFPAQTLPCQRQYLFEASQLRVNAGMVPITERGYGSEERQPIRSTLAFHIDRALPAGRLRVLENASDGAPEFIGEEDLAHTPRGETLAMQLGDAFDLRGERKQTDYQFDKDKRTLSESFVIRIVNASASPQSVLVREHLYRWTQWNIVQSSTKHEKRNADTAEFRLDVPANGNANASYTVQYQWAESYK